MRTHKIYSIINDINEKIYIGYTSRTLSWRLSKHFEEVEFNTSPTRKLHRAIKELGKEHFSIDLLFESDEKGVALGKMEQHFIEKHNSIKEGYNSRRGGGGVHLTEGQCKKVDVYDKNKNFIKTFPSRVSVADFVGCHPGTISVAISNADKGKGSQVKGYWVCHHGKTPVYKIPNTKPGSNAAREKNLGRKRPEHSKHMKENPSSLDTKIYKFEHIFGETFVGTRQGLIKAYPSHMIISGEMGMLIKGKYKSHRGWRLEKSL